LQARQESRSRIEKEGINTIERISIYTCSVVIRHRGTGTTQTNTHSIIKYKEVDPQKNQTKIYQVKSSQVKSKMATTTRRSSYRHGPAMTTPSPTAANPAYSEDDEENEEIMQANANIRTPTYPYDSNKSAADNWKGIGNRHMASQEYEEAYQAYTKALSISPLGPSSHIYLSNRAAALLSLKRYSAASVDARRAITLAPTFGKAHARLGQSLYFLKDFAGAVAAYENAYQFEPENQVTWTYLNKAKKKFARENERRRLKEEEEMDAWTNDGTSVTDSVNLDNMAINVVDEGRASAHERHLGVLSTHREHDAADEIDDIVGAVDRGESGIIQGKLQAALDNSNQPDRPHHGLLDETEDDIEDPDFDEALRLQELAAIKLVNKEYRDAVEEFSAALFLVPDDTNLTPQLYIGRAHALNGLQRHEGALNDAMMALGRNPDSIEAHIVLARTYFYLKGFGASVSSFQNAKDLMVKGGLGDSLSPLDELYLDKATENMYAQEEEFMEDKSFLSSSVIHSGKKVPKLKPPRFVSRQELIKSASSNIPPMPKAWSTRIQNLPATLRVGDERTVLFLSDAMGIKLNRGQDGIIRVLSVTPDTASSHIARRGAIYSGDIIREAAGVDLRRPLTNVMWSDTVALMKISPRPLSIVLAKELSERPGSVTDEFIKAGVSVSRKPDPPRRGNDPLDPLRGSEC